MNLHTWKSKGNVPVPMKLPPIPSAWWSEPCIKACTGCDSGTTMSKQLPVTPVEKKMSPYKCVTYIGM
jgi:hypothetical protein